MAKLAGMLAVAQPHHGQARPQLLEFRLVFAQLRDVQTAEYSTVLAKKNKYRNPIFPKGTQADLLTITIGKDNVSQRETERNGHSLPRLHHNPFANLIAWIYDYPLAFR